MRYVRVYEAEDTYMYADTRIVPAPDRKKQFLFVLLHDRDPGDLSSLANRWCKFMPDAVFAMPDGHLPSVGLGLPSAWFSGSGRHYGVTLKEAALKLHRYIDALKSEYGLTNQQIVLTGFGQGMTLAIYYGLTQSSQVCAIVGFGGEINAVDHATNEVASCPPVFLVHGQTDEYTPLYDALQNYIKLENAGVPTYTFFRPNVGHIIDGAGADAAITFVQGVIAAGRKATIQKRQSIEESAKDVKLVIWDLDDTLWEGTLDDIGDIQLNNFRVETIKQLNTHGIVSAICSKNDAKIAQATLEKFQLWDDFVFPRISFAPKGESLKILISEMQLKPKNCVFIDDNKLNLAEAKAILPDLLVIDANSPDCDRFLRELVASHEHVKKSRVEEYRSLQARVTESQQFPGDRESFLTSCDIHLCLVWKGDVADFAPRIEELINRTNQLNFLKTRVEPGTMLNFASEPSQRQCLAVFAWDKFGYHGLVGFIGIDMTTQTLLHMAFSCRIMHMGIENWLLHRATQMFPQLVSPISLDVQPYAPNWLKEEAFANPEVRHFILAEETKGAIESSSAKLRIMANCHSGTWAHFSGLRDVAEIDNFPRSFIMRDVLSKAYLQDQFAPALVYQIGTDFWDDKWPESAREQLTEGLYEACVTEFCDFVQENGHRLLIVGIPTELPDDFPHFDIPMARVRKFMEVWAEAAQKYDHIDLLELDQLIGVAGMLDVNHYTAQASRLIGKGIADWYKALPSAMFENYPLERRHDNAA